ncbi:hypothetical protein ACA910_020045 [Epithemia clementina (nom. ined.)]
MLPTTLLLFFGCCCGYLSLSQASFASGFTRNNVHKDKYLVQHDLSQRGWDRSRSSGRSFAVETLTLTTKPRTTTTAKTHHRHGLRAVSGSSSSSSSSSSGQSSPQQQQQQQRSLTAAEKERRDEDQRRNERAHDVVIGKTSAKRDERDYALDVSATEQEWMRQASKLEQEIYQQTEQGMHHLKMLDLKQASVCFDRVLALRPNAYLWQAGIVKYYLKDYQDAALILANSARYFERRFGEPATEERIWRNACQLKLESSIHKQERKRIEQQQGGIASLVTQIRDGDDDDDNVNNNENNNENNNRPVERRRVLRLARELFDATVDKNYSQVILTRAQLRSICGPATEAAKTTTPLVLLDRKMWKLNAWFYLGLLYDAVGQDDKSKNCMKMALRQCPSAGNAPDLVHTLPMLHMTRRNWFDDDHDFDSDLFSSSSSTTTTTTTTLQQLEPNNSLLWKNKDSQQISSPSPTTTTTTTTRTDHYCADDHNSLAQERIANADPVLVASLKDGIEELIVDELREELQKRDISSVGSKSELQAKLFDSLMRDVAQMHP